MADILPLKILWDRWSPTVARSSLVVRVSRPALLPHLRAIDIAQLADAPHSLALSGHLATAEQVADAVAAAGPRAATAGWPAPLLGITRDDNTTGLEPAVRGYAEALLEVRLAMLRMLQGGAPARVLPDALVAWNSHIVGGGDAEEAAPLPSTAWTLAESEPSWAARGIMLHLALHHAQPWPTGVGRTSRLLLNALVGAAGHPWISIPGNARADYVSSVERALTAGDARPFCDLLETGAAATS